MTTPAQNLQIIGNTFFDAGTAVALGCAGYQGTAVNSNVVVAFNQFNNCTFPVQVQGAGQNSVFNVLVTSNSASVRNSFAYGYGWSTNVSITANTTTGFSGGVNSTLLSGQWYPDDASNQFPPHNNTDNTGQTNFISYAFGMRHRVAVSRTNSVWVLDDTKSGQ